MKRLLAAGADGDLSDHARVPQRGARHAPQSRIHDDRMVSSRRHASRADGCCRSTGRLRIRSGPPGRGGSAPQLTKPFARLSYDEAFEAAIGRRVLALSSRELAALAKQLGVERTGLIERRRPRWMVEVCCSRKRSSRRSGRSVQRSSTITRHRNPRSPECDRMSHRWRNGSSSTSVGSSSATGITS